MDLNHFSTYFQFFAGINLGYAVFDYFREQLSLGIFNISKNISKELDFLKNRLEIQISEKNDDDDLSKLLKNVREEVNISSETLETVEEKERNFIEILEPISYISAFFCIITLVISGFIGDYADNTVVCENLFYVVFIFGVFCSIFSFLIFSGTFSDRTISNKLVISMTQIVISLLLFITFSYVIIFHLRNTIDTNYLLFLIVILPIIVYSFLSFINILKTEKYFEKKWTDIIVRFFKFCFSNSLYFLLFLIVLFLFFTPIALQIISKEKCHYSLYLVILTVPIFLYIFMPMRVFIHKINFKSKYSKLCKTQTIQLDFILSKIPKNG